MKRIWIARGLAVEFAAVQLVVVINHALNRRQGVFPLAVFDWIVKKLINENILCFASWFGVDFFLACAWFSVFGRR